MGKVSVNFRNNMKALYHKAISRQRKLLNKEKSNEHGLTLKKNYLCISNKCITLKKNIDKNKREKFWRKRRRLLEKIIRVKKQQKEYEAHKNWKSNGGIVGDLKPLKNALPILDELFNLCNIKEDLRAGIKECNGSLNNYGITQEKISTKRRLVLGKERFIRQVTSYAALLNDSDIKRSPRDAIKYHINQKYALDRE